MRKKLFAVIMSAMMMITFMPAMAFAAGPSVPVPYPDPVTGWQVSGVAQTAWGAAPNTANNEFVYDAQDHKVEYICTGTSATYTKTPYYQLWKKARWTDAAYTLVTQESAEAPVVKDSGWYKVVVTKVVEVDTLRGTTKTNPAADPVLEFGIEKRPVVVSFKDNMATELEKKYTGKGVVIDNDSFAFSALTADTKGAYSGLVTGDKFVTEAIETGSHVGTYELNKADYSKKLNANYVAYKADSTGAATTVADLKVRIVKADNIAKITSQVLIIKKGASKPVKFSTTFGTAKLTKLSGNTKISVKSGKIKVAKSLKKGTYKIKVKCSAQEDDNWTNVPRTKTLTIKVK